MPKKQKVNVKNKTKKTNSLRGGGWPWTQNKTDKGLAEQVELARKNFFLIKKDIYLLTAKCDNFYNNYNNLISNTETVINALNTFINVTNTKRLQNKLTENLKNITTASLQIRIFDLFQIINKQDILNNNDINNLNSNLFNLRELLIQYLNNLIKYKSTIDNLFLPNIETKRQAVPTSSKKSFVTQGMNTLGEFVSAAIRIG
jgi:hypothetical protein